MRYYEAKQRGECITVDAPVVSADVHFCAEPRVFFVHDGTLGITVNGKDLRLQGGQACIAESNAVTVLRVHENTNAVCVRFPLGFMQTFFAHTQGKAFADRTVTSPDVFAALCRLTDVFCACADRSAFFQESWANVFWSVLASRCPMRSFEPSAAADSMRAALGYIRAHYAQDLSLENLSALFGYSPYHFSRLFHAYTGVRLVPYINDVRLTEAARRLREGVSVAATAAACGFHGIRSFYREFTARFGRPPQQYARADADTSGATKEKRGNVRKIT